MRKPLLGVVVVVVIAVLDVFVWHHHGPRSKQSGPAATTGSAQISVVQAEQSHEDPAHVTVTVTDKVGPVADATIRVVNDRGEVSVLTAGKNGVAQTDVEPGDW